MVIKAINIGKELSSVTFLEGLTPESSESDLSAAFTTLSSYDNGGVLQDAIVARALGSAIHQVMNLFRLLKGEPNL